MDVTPVKPPVLPRRSFLAAGLSAVFAGAATSLAIFGGLSEADAASFQFSRGLSLANGEREKLRGFMAGALADERIHVTILGHTGDAGEATANLTLSEARAELARDVALDLGIPVDRITARGVGGAAPLPKQDGETDRAYQSRLARVEVSLQMRR